MRYALWILQILFVPILSPLGIGIINKIKAKMQRRKGPSIFQQYRNLRKLFHKDEVISKDASFIFRFMPVILFAVTIIVGASIPLFSSFLQTPTSDMLMVVYLLALGTFFLALGGMDTGGAFGGFGASREVTVSALAEISLIFSLLPAVLLSNTTNLMAIAGSITANYGHSLTPILLACAGFLIVLLAEGSRFPFDNPDTHLELTMIHEAMILEHSGKKLALIEWAAANKLFIFASLAANLFFPVGIAHIATPAAVAIGIGAILAKIFIIYTAIAVLESVIAKFRFFRLPDFLLISFVCSAVAIGLIR